VDEKCLQVDPEIRFLVIALREAGIDTDWSCAGLPGHMTIRPTIQAKTFPFSTWQQLDEQKAAIEKVLRDVGLNDYWLSLIWKRGVLDTHGGEPVWLLELPGRFDFLALPAAYSAKYQDDGDIVASFENVLGLRNNQA
jgi:hypothetical protein